MKRLTVSLLFWTFVSVLTVHAGDSMGTIASNFEGRHYYFTLSEKALLAAPQRKSGQPTPLSPAKAREVALEEAKKLCPQIVHWNASDASLQLFSRPGHSTPIFWVYLVGFENGDVDVVGLVTPLEIPVLMNGVAVEPTFTAPKTPLFSGMPFIPWYIPPDDGDPSRGVSAYNKIAALKLTLNWNKITVEQALRDLTSRSQRADPEHGGVKFVLHGQPPHIHISLLLEDAPATDVLGYLVQQTGLRIGMGRDQINFFPPSK